MLQEKLIDELSSEMDTTSDRLDFVQVNYSLVSNLRPSVKLYHSVMLPISRLCFVCIT